MIATGPGWELRWCGCRPDGDPATWDEAAADPAIVATLHGCLCPEHGLASLGQVDHVITDPPYDERINKHARSVNKHGQRSFVRYLNLGDAPTASVLLGTFAWLAKRWSLVFCADFRLHEWMQPTDGLDYIRTMAWVKTVTTPQVTGDRPAMGFECAALLHPPGKKRWNGRGKYGVWRHPQCMGPSRPNHPAPKPVPLMEEIVRDFTDPGDLVCDPFAGSGTTGVACIRLGRRFIGWERDPAFFEVARKRLENTKEQRQLFEASPKGKQGKLL